MRLADPLYLVLLLVVPAMLWLYLQGRARKPGAIRFSDIGILKRIGPTRSVRARHMLIVLRLAGAALLVLALARPQSVLVNEEILTEGIDIILALDRSGSILDQTNNLGIVGQGRSLFECRRHQVDGQSRIVELAIEIASSAAQSVRLDRRDGIDHFPP